MDRNGGRYGVRCASHAALQLSLNGSDSASTTRCTSQIRRDVLGGLRWSPSPDFAVPQQERANARVGQGYLLSETGSPAPANGPPSTNKPILLNAIHP